MTDLLYTDHPAFDELNKAWAHLDRQSARSAIGTLTAAAVDEADQAVLKGYLTNGVYRLSHPSFADMHENTVPGLKPQILSNTAMMVEDLLNAGADPHGGVTDVGEEPIVQALMRSNWAMVGALLKGAANPLSKVHDDDNSVGSDVFTLSIASLMTLIDRIAPEALPKTIVGDLISKGRRRNEESQSTGEMVCRRLMAKGFQVPTDAQTLGAAAASGNAWGVGLMIEAGADVRSARRHEILTWFPVQAPESSEQDEDRPRVVSRNHRSKTFEVHDGYTALHAAATYGHASTVQRLLELGAPLHAQTSHGATALHMAALSYHAGTLETIRLLMDAGSPVDQPDHRGRMPVDWAKPGSDTHRMLEQMVLQRAVASTHAEQGITPMAKPTRSRL